MRRDGQAGFTLIEVMASVAILATGLFVLLDAHYTALRLHDTMFEAVLSKQFLETAVQQAEVQVLNGELSGEDDFGARYPDHRWTYSATRVGDEGIELYQVRVTVHGPDDEPDADGESGRSMDFMTYAISPPDEEGIFSQTGSGRSGGS